MSFRVAVHAARFPADLANAHGRVPRRTCNADGMKEHCVYIIISRVVSCPNGMDEGRETPCGFHEVTRTNYKLYQSNKPLDCR